MPHCGERGDDPIEYRFKPLEVDILTQGKKIEIGLRQRVEIRVGDRRGKE